MKTITRKFELLVILCGAAANIVCGVTNASSSDGNNSVQEFLRQFTSLFNRTAFRDYVPSSRDKEIDEDYLNAINQQLSNYNEQFPNGPYPPPDISGPLLGQPPPYPGNGRPPPRPPYYGGYPGNGGPGDGFPPLLRPPGSGRPPPPGLGQSPPPYRPFPPGVLPVRPALPPGYRPPSGLYPQTSLIAALDSIARYDDLRCVPRLLCEVTSGTVPNSEDKSDKSPIPFLTKDALITLLTVLNFVDDSPILLFARAALLGYSSKGDIRACLTAYPTCPRDPDQLVNYLNNHNGGFFRFFNQQLQQQPQYAPQYQQSLHKYEEDTQRQPSETEQHDETTTKLSPRYPEYGFASRILNDPIDIENVGEYLSKIANARPPTRPHKSKVVFLSDQYDFADDLKTYDSNDYNSVVPTRVGKTFSFPGRPAKSSTTSSSSSTNVMIFPDRTGTGNLILSGDSTGNYRIVFANDQYHVNSHPSTSKIKFLSENGKYEKKLRFPSEE